MAGAERAISAVETKSIARMHSGIANCTVAAKVCESLCHKSDKAPGAVWCLVPVPGLGAMEFVFKARVDGGGWAP